MRIFEDYANEFYGEKLEIYRNELNNEDSKPDPEENTAEKRLFIEDIVAKELADLKEANAIYKTKEEKKKEFFTGYEIGCECGMLFFILEL